MVWANLVHLVILLIIVNRSSKRPAETDLNYGSGNWLKIEINEVQIEILLIIIRRRNFFSQKKAL